MKVLRIVLVVLLFIAAGGYFLIREAKTPLEKQPPVISSGKAEIGGPFQLINTNGNIVSDDSLHGKFVLVYFGYTNCPDVCPIDMNRISMALDILEQDIDLTSNIQPVFITVDPVRDTPEAIDVFLSYYHKSFIGLTGTQAQIEKLAADYKVYIEQIMSSEHNNMHEYTSAGLINHSSYIYLMGPEGLYVTHFDADIPSSALAAALKNYLKSR